jgi:tRNA 5-methylaminomethyl-2-thiouridine biosynthesis bifunctional protein
MTVDRAAWTVLDTHFGNGQDFWNQVGGWKTDSNRPSMLHYVGICPLDEPLQWIPELEAVLTGIASGFHRITFEGGHVSLTLCLCNRKQALEQLNMQANAVWLKPSHAMWDVWALKAVAKLCCPEASVFLDSALELAPQQMAEADFFAESGVGFADGLNAYSFRPRSPLTRRGLVGRASPPTDCVVIGAGLAGASIARALAVRGCQVTVLDSSSEPAHGASGLPVGLMAPHVSADDSALSRLSRSGVRLMMQHASEMLTRGRDWEPSGVIEIQDNGSALRHAQAGWIRPAQLVHAWLDHPAIRFKGRSEVHTMERRQGQWILTGEHSQVLAKASHLVLANASGCRTLLQDPSASCELDPEFHEKLDGLQEVFGTLSHAPMVCAELALQSTQLPGTPVNGNGSFVHSVEFQSELQWFAGSTFETDPSQWADKPGQHWANHQKLCQLLPGIGEALRVPFEQGRVSAWSGVRCVSHDRLPLVGPISASTPHHLWMNAAMGARGLSLSALCAQLLVAQMFGEPLPVEANLARQLNATRPRRKHKALD